LTYGADATAESRGSGAKLQRVVTDGNLEIVRFQLESGAIADLKAADYEITLLAATFNRHVVVVQLLLESGADTEARTGLGWTTLHLPALTGDNTLVWLLLDAGTNIDAKNHNKATELHKVANQGMGQC